MQTITFYSYKGGTGRTLTLANVARYLARFGRRVFAIDLDLEAPGLHFKLLGTVDGLPSVKAGIVDYLHEFVTTGMPPNSLAPYVLSAPHVRDEDASIHILPAGDVPGSSYWRKLAQISWHDLFYSEVSPGIPLFLDLQQKIQVEFSPDFLLIDARTGITEIGGVATTVLADTVVCTLLTNFENLYGARTVLRSIKSTPRLADQSPVEILTVLSRIPPLEPEAEHGLIRQTLEFLNEAAENLATTLSLDDLLVLHSEPRLQVTESLLIGDTQSPNESPLLRDYLRLITRIIPPADIGPQIERLVEQIMGMALRDPDQAQSELEALSDTSGHPDAYRALLRYYRLRNTPKNLLMDAAARFWDATRDPQDSVLWEAVKIGFDESIGRYEDIPWQWVEQLWLAEGRTQIDVGWNLARSYKNFGKDAKASSLALYLLNAEDPTLSNLEFALDVLAEAKITMGIENILLQILVKHASEEDFATTIAEFLLNGQSGLLRKFADELLNCAITPDARARLLIIMGREDEARELLPIALDTVITAGELTRLIKVGRLFRQFGKETEFEMLLRSSDTRHFRSHDTPWRRVDVDDILKAVREHGRE